MHSSGYNFVLKAKNLSESRTRNNFKKGLTSTVLILKFQPRVIGRYGYGREEKIVLADMSASEVDQAIASLANGPSN